MKKSNKLINYLALMAAYFGFNLRAQLGYRAAFWLQAGAMFVNNCIWLVYFTMLFDRFPIVPGWHATDVATLWAVTAGGFGIAHSMFGNTLTLARIIANGDLDVWLLYPRAPLTHLMLGRMSASAFGDAVFGYAVYIFVVRPDLAHLCMFAILTFSVAILFLGFSIMTGSMSFYLGNADTLSEHWRGALIAFSTYPTEIFDGKVRILLLTIIPAAYVSGYPIQALRTLSLENAFYSLLGALLLVTLGVLTFSHGLKRYESGNMVHMRG